MNFQIGSLDIAEILGDTTAKRTAFMSQEI